MNVVPRPRNGLSLCAGGGGLDLGLMLAEPGFHTRCFVEWEEYPRKVIIGAQRAQYFTPAPIWDDVTAFDGTPFRGAIDTILAGYPCQPFSHAGQRKGEDDERHLWPHIARIIREVEPTWVFLENVAGHVTLGAETVLRELWGMGFTPAAGLFTAAETGATHKRERWFCVAYSDANADTRRLERGGYSDSTGQGQGESEQRERIRARVRGCCSQLPEGDGALANSGLRRLRESGKGQDQQQRRAEVERGSDLVEYAERPQRAGPSGQRAQRKTGQASGLGAGRDHMADAECYGGHEGRHGHAYVCARGKGKADRAGTSGETLFPPGPGDRMAWEFTLQCAGHLAPAVSLRQAHAWARYCEAAGSEWDTEAESPVCRMADALAERTRALRLLGNGVVPICAGFAWRTLASAHGLLPVDLEAPGRDGHTGARRTVLTETA